MNFRVFSLGILLTSLASVMGCSNYQLGTATQLEFSTLYIAPVEMNALIPQAQPILETMIREGFIRDGRINLVNSADRAEAILQISVRDYRREVASARPDDTGLARKFIITLTTEATLIQTSTGHEWFHGRLLEVRRDVYTDSGQQQAEYQLLPQLAQDLAAKATHAVLDTW